MDADQKMDMIRLPTQFDERTPPIRENLRESLPSGIANLRG